MGLEHPSITKTRQTGYPECEPKPIKSCHQCGSCIYKYDEYFKFDGCDFCHKECVSEWLFENRIIELKIARKD